MSENQKLREALRELMSIVSIHQKATRNNFAWAEMKFAEEALALPTAEQVGERDAFEKWILDATGYIGASVKRDQEGQYKSDITESAWDAWQARAAMSAGDAVDAQRYRWLMDNCTLGIKQNGVGWSLNTTACIAPDCIKDVGATIDAAMRKGQL